MTIELNDAPAHETTGNKAAELCPACRARGTLQPALRGRDRMIGTPGEHEVWICGICGSGAARPYAGEAELGRFYGDDYLPHVPTSGSGVARLLTLVSRVAVTMQSRALFVGFPLARYVGRPGGTVIDIGCGRGDLAAEFIRRGWRASGIDIVEAACAAARERGVDAHAGTLATVELPAAEFDLAVFQQSLEHVAEPTEALARAYSLVRPGGEIVVSVPNFDSWERRCFGSRWFHLDLPRHRTHFSAHGLRSALAAAGFRDIEIGYNSNGIGVFGSTLYALLGRWPFKGGAAGRIAIATSMLLLTPVVWVLDRLAGRGEGLHAIARRPH